jgi:hypothetical protein
MSLDLKKSTKNSICASTQRAARHGPPPDNLRPVQFFWKGIRLWACRDKVTNPRDVFAKVLLYARR